MHPTNNASNCPGCDNPFPPEKTALALSAMQEIGPDALCPGICTRCGAVFKLDYSGNISALTEEDIVAMPEKVYNQLLGLKVLVKIELARKEQRQPRIT